ncbi:MAG: DUF362 domain-containing protein [Candidatus Aminicenantia bacterium]
MAKKISRRDFIEKSAKVGISAAFGGSIISHFFNGSPVHALRRERVDIAVVSGSDYFNNTIKAIELLGGIEKFVPKNSAVAILPNTQSKHPGTYTKPDIVRAVIKMCKKAGAKEINCLSWLPRRYWEATGLAKAVEDEGANLKIVDLKDESLFKPLSIPKGKVLKEAKIMREFFNNDVFINIPITKDHAGNKFTGTMKNLMGLNFSQVNRFFHTGAFEDRPDNIEHLDQCIADLNTIIKPNLCIVDATELITTNGPFGPGNLIKLQKIVAGVDRVAIDAYCATLWGMEGEDIIMIKRAFEHKLGEIDLKKLKIKELKI